ncbi:Uncharacterised protein [uncultured archaeon]|nr:Uncharacterised protein [uncultured archaeon]
MSLLRKLFWRFMEAKEINFVGYPNEKVRLEDITIPNLRERDKLTQECKEQFEEMSMFQHEEEYSPLIKILERLAELDFIAGVYCSQQIQNLKKEDAVDQYFKEQYDYLNKHLCWTKIMMQEIRDKRDGSDNEYEFV